LPRSRRSRQSLGGLARYHVFGLHVESRVPIEAAPLRHSAAGFRHVSLEQVASPAALGELWRSDEARSVIDRRTPSGRLVMSIDSHPTLGYRIAAPGHGRYVVSGDGTRIHSALSHTPGWRWQRLLFAQALPLAAALQGLELFHASAVAFDGRAVGLVAASGAGKSSVAAHLVAGGAAFVTDDVLALEPVDHTVLAHPGPRLASIHASELRRLDGEARGRLGEVVGRSRKLYLSIPTIERTVPLAAVYFLERSEDVRELRIVDSSTPDPRLLLSSSFIWYLTEAAFLVEHLDACARMAQAVRVSRVLIPSSVGAALVASAVTEHARGEG
jgi:hypothetical protein